MMTNCRYRKCSSASECREGKRISFPYMWAANYCQLKTGKQQQKQPKPQIYLIKFQECDLFFHASRWRLHVSHINLLYQAFIFYCKVVLTQKPLLPSMQSCVNNDEQWQVFLKCRLYGCIFTTSARMPLGQEAEVHAIALSDRLLENVDISPLLFLGSSFLNCTKEWWGYRAISTSFPSSELQWLPFIFKIFPIVNSKDHKIYIAVIKTVNKRLLEILCHGPSAIFPHTSCTELPPSALKTIKATWRLFQIGLSC